MTDLEINSEIHKAVDVLRAGGIILYPTDTVWGIGCDATNPEAIRRIYALKQREDAKSMLALVSSKEMLAKWVKDIPSAASEILLTEQRPVTIIYDEPLGVASNLTASDGSLGIRVSRERFSSALCEELGRPIVSTSANISGRPTAPFYNQIDDAILKGVDYIPTYRRDDLTPASPSKIVKVTSGNEVIVLRD